MTGRVTFTIEDGIGRILLDRADKMNAITPEMTLALQEVCRAVDANRDVRVVTIAGAGERAFSAGSDLNTLADLSDVMAFRDRIEYAALVRDIRKPVIAALKGWVLGGGMEIALAADIRICGRSARIGGPEVTRGWLGGGGASQMLPRLIGVGQTMRLLLTGRSRRCRNGAAPRPGRGSRRRRRGDGAGDRSGEEDRFVQSDRDPGHQGRGSRRDVDAAGGRAVLRERTPRHLHVGQGAAGRHQGLPGKTRREVLGTGSRVVEPEELHHQVELAFEHVDTEMDGVTALFGGNQQRGHIRLHHDLGDQRGGIGAGEIE